MHNYYIKKAKECEQAIALLQQQIERMNTDDDLRLQQQMAKVRRELNNYRAAVERATADYASAVIVKRLNKRKRFKLQQWRLCECLQRPLL